MRDSSPFSYVIVGVMVCNFAYWTWRLFIA
jgi:hypothetical protein